MADLQLTLKPFYERASEAEVTHSSLSYLIALFLSFFLSKPTIPQTISDSNSVTSLLRTFVSYSTKFKLLYEQSNCLINVGRNPVN